MQQTCFIENRLGNLRHIQKFYKIIFFNVKGLAKVDKYYLELLIIIKTSKDKNILRNSKFSVSVKNINS